MLEIHAVGQEASQRSIANLYESRNCSLGRSSRCEIAAPWDQKISRIHAEVTLQHGSVQVRKLETSKHPLIYRDQELTSILLRAGEEFRIGDTTFLLIPAGDSSANDAEPAGFEEYTFAPSELRKVPFVQTQGKSLELLTTIPKLMRDAKDDASFAAAMVDLLLDAIPRCSVAAVVVFDDAEPVADDGQPVKPTITRWNSRDEGIGPFRPSRRLMMTAMSSEQSILHIWGVSEKDAVFTNASNLDWAFCTPLLDESARGWCLYLSGTFDALTPSATKDKLQEPMRFTELTAQFIGATRSVRLLQQTQTRMSHFLPPAVVRTITNKNAEAMLRPRESNITVLFCDLRGFSRKTEEANQDLPGLLSKISEALSAMARCIMEQEGVIADFQGDAALAFWGWPQTTDIGPVLACRAALAIEKEFAAGRSDATHALHGLSIGIGIGHGLGIAGQIGPPEQSKVGVFGAVVNQASRLQSVTKRFRTPILMDDATAEVIASHANSGEFRCRRIAQLQPRGMNTVMTISQLLNPHDAVRILTDEQLRVHELALNKFIEGRWTESEELFRTQLADDEANLLLRDIMSKSEWRPPHDWNGVVTFQSE